MTNNTFGGMFFYLIVKAKFSFRSWTPTGANSAMKLWEFLAIICYLLKKRNENHLFRAQLVFFFSLVEKTSRRSFSQSVCLVIAITKLLSTIIWKLQWTAMTICCLQKWNPAGSWSELLKKKKRKRKLILSTVNRLHLV